MFMMVFYYAMKTDSILTSKCSLCKMVVCSWNTRLFSDLALGVQNPNSLHYQITIPKERWCVTYHHNNSPTHFLSLKALQAFYPLTLVRVSLNIFDNLLNSVCVPFVNSNFWKFKSNRIKICIFFIFSKRQPKYHLLLFCNKVAWNCWRWLNASLIILPVQNHKDSDFKNKSYWKIRTSREGLWWDPASASAFKEICSDFLITASLNGL